MVKAIQDYVELNQILLWESTKVNMFLCSKDRDRVSLNRKMDSSGGFRACGPDATGTIITVILWEEESYA